MVNGDQSQDLKYSLSLKYILKKTKTFSSKIRDAAIFLKLLLIYLILFIKMNIYNLYTVQYYVVRIHV